jgi:hypothetical protein
MEFNNSRFLQWYRVGCLKISLEVKIYTSSNINYIFYKTKLDFKNEARNTPK